MKRVCIGCVLHKRSLGFSESSAQTLINSQHTTMSVRITYAGWQYHAGRCNTEAEVFALLNGLGAHQCATANICASNNIFLLVRQTGTVMYCLHPNRKRQGKAPEQREMFMCFAACCPLHGATMCPSLMFNTIAGSDLHVTQIGSSTS